MTTENIEIKVKIEYSKTSQSRYVSHLDNIDVITKALRRLQLPYAVSQGCHIRPKLSFAPPLPLGHASYCEYLIITLEKEIEPEKLKTDLTDQLPEGMTVTNVIQPWIEKKSKNIGERLEYLLHFRDLATAQIAKEYLSDPESSFEGHHKGKTKKYKLGKAVSKISLSASEGKNLLAVEFEQGIEGIPSVSKIITALAEALDKDKDSLYLIERISLTEL